MKPLTEKKLFTKTELKKFGEFCRDEAKQQQAQEFEKMINDWYIKTRDKKTYVDLSDVQELLKEVRGDKK